MVSRDKYNSNDVVSVYVWNMAYINWSIEKEVLDEIFRKVGVLTFIKRTKREDENPEKYDEIVKKNPQRVSEGLGLDLWTRFLKWEAVYERN